MEASAPTVTGGRSALERSPAARLPDQVLQLGLTALASLILLLIAYFFVRLIGQSGTTLNKFGLSFIFGNDWDVSRNIYHGAPLVVGTLITSAIALLIGVPVAVATALYLTELSPRRARAPLASWSISWPRCPRSSTGCGASSCSAPSSSRWNSGLPTRFRSFRSSAGAGARSRPATTSSPG